MLSDLYNNGDITDAASLAASKLVGHRGTNSSIGSQWSKGRSTNLYNNTNDQYSKLEESKKEDVKMNVELKYK